MLTGSLQQDMSTTHHFNETIASDLTEAERIQERIVGMLEALEFPPRDVFGMRLALEEAIVNAIKHGNGMDPEKSLRVSVDVDSERVVVEIEDEGPGFNPRDVPDPTAAENIERPGGRGIMLMRAFMSSVEFNEAGNLVRLEKLRGGEEDDS